MKYDSDEKLCDEVSNLVEFVVKQDMNHPDSIL